MFAVVPMRGATLPAGGMEALAECCGHGLLASDSGADWRAVAAELAGFASAVSAATLGDFHPARWAAALAPLAAEHDHVVLPHSPDGRDLAPHLARALRRPLYASALQVTATRIHVSAEWSGAIAEHEVRGPYVATLIPGVRGVESAGGTPPVVETIVQPMAADEASSAVVSLGVLDPDPATVDLAEAERIVGGGAGLRDGAMLAKLGRVGTAIGASLGATRVLTDRGWLDHTRQIGTTGVVVDPRLYLAFGISGAVQHTSGLGTPAHIVSVNTDAHCPMMQLADLAVVSDANAVLDELATLLGVE